MNILECHRLQRLCEIQLTDQAQFKSQYAIDRGLVGWKSSSLKQFAWTVKF